MPTQGHISLTLAAPNISSFRQTAPVRVGIRDDRIFLFESEGKTRTPTAILERKRVDEAMVKVFQQYVFFLEGSYQDDENGTQKNLLRDAINGPDFDYRFSTKDAPDLWLEYDELLTEFQQLRTAVDVVELNICLWECHASKVLRKLLKPDDETVASVKSRVSMSGSRKSSKPGRHSPHAISPTGDPVHSTSSTTTAPSPVLPAALQSIRRRTRRVMDDLSEGLKDVLDAARSSPKVRDEGEFDCSSEMSDGLNAPLPETVDVPTKGVVTPPSNPSGNVDPGKTHQTPQPPSSIVNWRSHSVNMEPLSEAEVAANNPSAPSGPPLSSKSVLQCSSVVNIPNAPTGMYSADLAQDPAEMPTMLSSNCTNTAHTPTAVPPGFNSPRLQQKHPSVVDGHAAAGIQPSQHYASVDNGLISERGNEDDQQSALSGSDVHSEFGALYCDPSKENDGDPFADPSVIAQLKSVPGRVLLGYTWEEYTKPCPSVDFPNAHPPWIGWHADKGYILSFPVFVDNKCQSKANYIRHFKNVTYDPTKLPKSWREQFPTFPKSADLDTIPIFHFVRALVVHCYNHNIYCPPIHTVNKLEPRGWWYSHLSPSTQHLVQEYWSSLLHTSLCDARTGLVTHARLHSLLNEVSDGYAAIVQLLELARHPHLTVHSVRSPMPTQGNMSLLKYFNAWQETLLIDTVRGITPSDRAYVCWVVNGLHPSMQRVGERVLSNMERQRDDAPLPLTFAPCYLFQLFSSVASTLGVSTNVRPRSSDDVNAVVNAVTNAAGKKMSTNQGSPAKPPKQSRVCYLCDANHLIRDCPKLPEMRRQLSANASKMVRRLVNEPELAPDPTDDLIRSIFAKSGLGGGVPSDVSIDSGSDDDASVSSTAKTVFR